MGATIRDIAKLVGVSASTVSRVINGNTAISQETRIKIQEAMKELNYHPNSRARNLANGITNTIALVIDAEDENTFANTFFNRSVYAVETAAHNNGCNLLITNDNDEKGKSISTLVYEKKVDGLILPSSSIREGLLELLEKEAFPYVVLGEPEIGARELAWVDINNRDGGRKAVTHLLEQGYRKIAFVAENTDTVFSRERIAGYEEALAEQMKDSENTICKKEMSGSQPKTETSKPVSRTGESMIFTCGEDAGGMVGQVVDAAKKRMIDAVICCNNILAYHVMKGLREAEISVPDRVGVVTFDNYPLAEYMDPPLTVVDVDTYRLGKEAADMLFRKIGGEAAENDAVSIDTEIIIRNSSKRREELNG